ncbi:two-component regulator propeller domain-containing protein [Bacteroides sp. 519]|uniref:hybrid sensor histidine kinase/response regulator transcription factor n=1 Tax=Bacteroides sp. 519 TaxID=2302937 RepID=UPI0013D2C56D|nr:two-component regulator propeller domain-containing protein [Bacteroides sp. 519]NDV57108.1 response regulator [Bacteroides sp. 519]
MRNALTFLFILFSLFCKGQAHKLFTTDMELSSSLINQLYQDQNGFIWIATEDGLNRYDGAKFTIYKNEPDNEHSLSHNYVRVMFEDSKGHLYIGTYIGIQMYNPDTDNFTPLARWDNGEIFESNIMDIIERQDGSVWVSGNNLCTLTIKGNELIVTRVDIPVQISRDMIEDKSLNVWITMGEEGVYKLDTNNNLSKYLPKDNGSISCICEDAEGEVYVGSLGKGLLKYDKETDDFVPVYAKNKKLPIKTLYPDGQNELLIGTDGQGMAVYNDKRKEISEYHFDSGYFDPKNSKIHGILKDNAGNLWLAVYQKGVFMIPPKANSFKYMGHKSINRNIIGSNCITSLCKDHNNILWVGTDNDGIYGITEQGRQLHHYSYSENPNSVPPTIIKLYEDSEQNLWLGSFINGMGKLDRKTGNCTYQHDLVDKNGNNIQRVYDFAEDKNKRLWIATMGAGLFYYDLAKKQFVYSDAANTNVNSWICCLFYSNDNKLYVGSYDGVNCIDLDTYDFKNLKLFSSHLIYSIYEDKDGVIWMGSAQGLCKWDKTTGETTKFTTANGLPSNTIYAIEESDDDFLWLSTNAGLSMLRKKNNQFVNYYVGDGLQGNEFYKNASLKDSKGIIWFGGTNGITYFNPREITNPAKKWDVRITEFFLHNRPVRKGMKSGKYNIIDSPVFNADEFHLSHNDNVFTIEFAPVELNAPERITYQYSMNGDQWISLPKGSNRISFSDLVPGTYDFRIKAKDYTMDSDIKKVLIHIYPAWYASWWAKVIYFLILVTIILVVILQIRHRYRMKHEMLQHIHAEQINEAKLQFFINISHEIRTPMSLIISPLQKLIKTDDDGDRQKTYNIIYRNAERILHLVNQLMDMRKIDKGQMTLKFRETNIIPFIEDLCQTFAQPAVNKNIELQFHHEMQKLDMWVDPDNFDKIILNILSNALKFTPNGGKIDIDLQKGKDQTIEIIVSDTGPGIDNSEKEHIFERFYQVLNNKQNAKGGTGIGLHLTRSLVELHHGEIVVENNDEGPGCRFIIRLPSGKQHLRPEELDNAQNRVPDYIVETPVLPVVNVDVDSEKKKVKAKNKSRILVVEDDEEIRQYICREFASLFHVMECCNGKEALSVIFKKKIDLVISDIMMPEMDGLTLCKKIKQNVNLNHIPVILLTARSREEDNIEGLDIGADAYITKPFNIDILQKTAENLINTRNKLRQVYSGQQLQEDKIQKIEVKSPDEKLLERVMKVINENIGNPGLTVEMITEKVGISRVHLHRKLKELTNQSTRDFIRNIRLKEAARLLSEKQHTIGEIAELTGFADPNNFSTSFKELYGIPPTVYMKEQLDKNES